MAADNPTTVRLPFQPRPGMDDLLSVFLLWQLAGHVEANDRGCWEWKGARTKAGYGSFHAIHLRGGTVRYVHRAVYLLCVGELPEGEQVLHHCDNPPCVNPAHLFAGTQKENVADMDKKGRRVNTPTIGEASPNAKLTDEIVREVRRRVASGEPTTQKMADELNINFATLRRIVTGRAWRHIQ